MQDYAANLYEGLRSHSLTRADSIFSYFNQLKQRISGNSGQLPSAGSSAFPTYEQQAHALQQSDSVTGVTRSLFNRNRSFSELGQQSPLAQLYDLEEALLYSSTPDPPIYEHGYLKDNNLQNTSTYDVQPDTFLYQNNHEPQQNRNETSLGLSAISKVETHRPYPHLEDSGTTLKENPEDELEGNTMSKPEFSYDEHFDTEEATLYGEQDDDYNGTHDYAGTRHLEHIDHHAGHEDDGYNDGYDEGNHYRDPIYEQDLSYEESMHPHEEAQVDDGNHDPQFEHYGDESLEEYPSEHYPYEQEHHQSYDVPEIDMSHIDPYQQNYEGKHEQHHEDDEAGYHEDFEDHAYENYEREQYPVTGYEEYEEEPVLYDDHYGEHDGEFAPQYDNYEQHEEPITYDHDYEEHVEAPMPYNHRSARQEKPWHLPSSNNRQGHADHYYSGADVGDGEGDRRDYDSAYRRNAYKDDVRPSRSGRSPYRRPPPSYREDPYDDYRYEDDGHDRSPYSLNRRRDPYYDRPHDFGNHRGRSHDYSDHYGPRPEDRHRPRSRSRGDPYRDRGRGRDVDRDRDRDYYYYHDRGHRRSSPQRHHPYEDYYDRDYPHSRGGRGAKPRPRPPPRQQLYDGYRRSRNYYDDHADEDYHEGYDDNYGGGWNTGYKGYDDPHQQSYYDEQAYHEGYSEDYHDPYAQEEGFYHEGTHNQGYYGGYHNGDNDYSYTSGAYYGAEGHGSGNYHMRNGGSAYHAY